MSCSKIIYYHKRRAKSKFFWAANLSYLQTNQLQNSIKMYFDIRDNLAKSKHLITHKEIKGGNSL